MRQTAPGRQGRTAAAVLSLLGVLALLLVQPAVAVGSHDDAPKRNAQLLPLGPLVDITAGDPDDPVTTALEPRSFDTLDSAHGFAGLVPHPAGVCRTARPALGVAPKTSPPTRR